MQKKALLALLIALAVMLSGCALVRQDTAADNARIILSVNGETVNKATVSNTVEYTVQQNNYYNQLYSQLGYSAGYDTNRATVLTSVLDSYVQNLLEGQKVKKLGFDTLSDEDQAAVAQQAQEQYDQFLTQVETNYLKDSENEGDALKAEAQAWAEENGYGTLEDIQTSLENTKKVSNMKEDLLKDVQPTDEDLQNALTEKITANKEKYDKTLSDFGYDYNNGTATFYAPEGYRYVKQVLIKYTDEDNTAITEANTTLSNAKAAYTKAETALEDAKQAVTDAEGDAEADMDALNAAVEEAQKALDEATVTRDAAQQEYDDAKAVGLNNILPKAQEVCQKYADGADFSDLIKEYNQDPGMESAPGSETGYAVCEGYQYFDANFVAAAMGLENVGDITEPTAGSYGYYIIRYESDVTPGEKTLDQARADLEADVTESLKTAKYNEIMDQWIAESDIQRYPEKMGY